ncbi:MAG: hypothetical protein ACJAXJ_004061 [Colwellia sp.]|jgi:hypothetical protein
MINPSKVNILISIAAKGRGCIAEFIRPYTMQEHSDDKYIADGEAYALEHFNLKKDSVVVQDSPVIDKQLVAKIEDRWGSGDKVVPGHMAIPKVHNPMHSCFRAYRTLDIGGVTVLVKPVSAGIVYAIQNDTWINELKVA